MKTPIQEAIDFINELNDNDTSGFDYYYPSIVEKLKELLEMEQKQLKEMYLKGIENYDPTFKRKSQWTVADKIMKVLDPNK